ncbi:MAG: phage tail tip lysozyme [Eggerthellaceae bacterium]|nr:phage tail tip lysozyme [Eggerthellaceae bacterium]
MDHEKNALSMKDLVGKERKDLINTGVIKVSRENSLTTLNEEQSVLLPVEKTDNKSQGKKAKAKPAESSRSSRRKNVHDGKAHSAPEKATSEGGVSSFPYSSDKEKETAARKASSSSSSSSFLNVSPKEIAFSAAFGALDESEELEGIDEFYRSGKRVKKVVSLAKRSATNRSKKSVTACSVTGETATEPGIEGIPSASERSHLNQIHQAIINEQNTSAAAAGIKKAAEAKGIGSLFALPSLGPVALVIGIVTAFVVTALLIAQMMSVIFGFWDDAQSVPPASIGDVEQEIISCLRDYGFSDVAIAAILGNLKAESGLDPASDVVLDGLYNYEYERACGLFQYTSTSPQSGEYWAFKNWCDDFGYAWYDVSSQMKWTFSGESPTGLWTSHYSTALARSGYYTNCPGYTNCGYYTAEEFAASTDIVCAAFSWMACYERPANGYAAHLDSRIEYARQYLAALSDENSSKASIIIQAAQSQLGVPYIWGGSTPYVGLDCSGLTQYCYAMAGISISHNSESQYAELQKVPLSEAEPGDILYKYGHVAIYIGDDTYIHEPGSGKVCCEGHGISTFTCALRAS